MFVRLLTYITLTSTQTQQLGLLVLVIHVKVCVVSIDNYAISFCGFC